MKLERIIRLVDPNYPGSGDWHSNSAICSFLEIPATRFVHSRGEQMPFGQRGEGGSCARTSPGPGRDFRSSRVELDGLAACVSCVAEDPSGPDGRKAVAGSAPAKARVSSLPGCFASRTVRSMQRNRIRPTRGPHHEARSRFTPRRRPRSLRCARAALGEFHPNELDPHGQEGDDDESER